MQIGCQIISEIKKLVNVPIIYDGKIADIPYISTLIAKFAYRLGADAVIVHGIVSQTRKKSHLLPTHTLSASYLFAKSL